MDCRIGKGLVNLCGLVVMVGCVDGRILGGMQPRILGVIFCKVTAIGGGDRKVGQERVCKN